MLMLNFRPVALVAWSAAVFLLSLGCSESPPLLEVIEEREPILIVRGEAASIGDLEILAVLAGYQLDSEEDQERFRRNAANFYETLIDLYVMKYVAEDMGFIPPAEEAQALFESTRDRLRQQGYYQSMLDGLGLTEDEFKETLAYQQAVRRLQEAIMHEFDIQVSENDVRQFYYQNNPQFRFPNRIRASHIYIAAPEGMDAAEREQARRRAEQLHNMIGDNPNRTFANLAQQYSEDSNTRPRGGDLGLIKREDETVDRRFMDAAFSLQEGEVSGVVETRYGYHIIWVTRHEIPLEEAHDVIRQQLLRQQRDERFKTWLLERKETMEIERLFDPETFVYPVEP